MAAEGQFESSSGKSKMRHCTKDLRKPSDDEILPVAINQRDYVAGEVSLALPRELSSPQLHENPQEKVYLPKFAKNTETKQIN